MKTIAELTPKQFTDLLTGFYAHPENRKKMTDDEVKDLAIRLNKKINVPIISETGEEKILIKIILRLDNFLYDHLPNEFYDLVRSSDKGIDKEEAKRLVVRLTRIANEKIDIPYIPEKAEHIAIKFVIGIIVRAARKKFDFDGVRADSDDFVIPDTDDDIEALAG